MLQAMYSGVSGMQAHETRMNVIGNNIANVNTYGFKSGRTSFQDQLAQTLRTVSGPSGGNGGQNPAQVGLGVTLASIDTIQTQGNLQTTGRSSDLALQGSGFFMVSDGTSVQYTRDGTFDLDSSGALVNQATGRRLVGWTADSSNNIDTSAPVTSTSALRVPIGQLGQAHQTDNMTFLGNLDAAASLASTRVDFSGHLSTTSVAGEQTETTNTLFDAQGKPHVVTTVLYGAIDNPTGADVPAGATRAWNVRMSVDGATAYDSANGQARMFSTPTGMHFTDATGASLGSSVILDGGTGANHGSIIKGTAGAPDVPATMSFSGVTTSAAASSVTGIADGQTGTSPTWGTALRTYDSLGLEHLISFKFDRATLSANAPAGATSMWNWTASEGDKVVGTSADAGNTGLYFNSLGKLVGGGIQTATVTPNQGTVNPYTIKIDYSKLTQMAGEGNATASYQDGYVAGTMQGFTVSSDGIISGLYSNGQSRNLGRIAIASFLNPGGLEKTGNNLFRESSNSGMAQVGLAGQSGRGKVSAGFLEMSNVDLTSEFTNLIVTERGFQSNSRIISVVDQLMQAVIDLKR